MIPGVLYVTYSQTRQYDVQTAEENVIENSLKLVAYFVSFLEPSIGFYTNLLISKTFRIEFKHAIFEMHRPCCCQGR